MATRNTMFTAGAAVAVALVVGAESIPPAFAMEAKVYAIGDFVPPEAGGCGGNDIGHWPVMVDHWYDHMAVHGHTKDGQYTNGNMTIQRFCDPDWNAGCQDFVHADDADAVMIATHGADSGDHWQGLMRWPWSGHCRLDAGGSADDMWLGEIDNEFIHLSSCNSGDDDNVWGIWNMMHDPVDGRSFAHQADVFHGCMWIGNRWDNDYKEFAHDAHAVDMGRSWVNNLYDNRVDCEWYDPWNWFGTCQEQCPVAYAVGTSGNNALSRLNSERYNNVWSDITGYGGAAIRYVVGCDPACETRFSP